MTNGAFSTYVDRLMHHEIIPTLVEIGIDKTEAAAFADYVIDRFSNPYLEHKWESISANYTSKMRMRNLATLERYFKDGSRGDANRSEEHTSELQSLMRISYAVFCLKKTNKTNHE